MIKTIASNIVALLKLNDIKVSEFEVRHNVSRGYLSRKIKSGGAFDLGTALSMAKELNVGIDELLHIDYVKICEKELLERKIKQLQTELKALEGGEQ